MMIEMKKILSILPALTMPLRSVYLKRFHLCTTTSEMEEYELFSSSLPDQLLLRCVLPKYRPIVKFVGQVFQVGLSHHHHQEVALVMPSGYARLRSQAFRIHSHQDEEMIHLNNSFIFQFSSPFRAYSSRKKTMSLSSSVTC